MLACLAIWLALPYFGKHYLTPSKRHVVAITLIVITLFQEAIFDVFQLYIDDFDIADEYVAHIEIATSTGSEFISNAVLPKDRERGSATLEKDIRALLKKRKSTTLKQAVLIKLLKEVSSTEEDK